MSPPDAAGTRGSICKRAGAMQQQGSSGRSTHIGAAHQQDQQRSPESEVPKATNFGPTTTGQVDASKKFLPGESIAHPAGLDTVVLTRRFYHPLELKSEWQAARSPRWNPYTKMREHGWLHLDAGAQGWWLDCLPERNVLEITLQIPKIMGSRLCNYPIQPFHMWMVGRLGPLIEREVGLFRGIGRANAGKKNRTIGWDQFGVRRADYAIDLVVPNKTTLIRALKTCHRSGKQRIWGDETVQWTTGGKVVQFYDTLVQLKSTLCESDLTDVIRRNPELPHVVRFEARLTTGDLRKLFGLRVGWLPRLALVAQSGIAPYILYEELARRLKVANLNTGPRLSMDTVAAQADEILRRAAAGNIKLKFASLSQILVANALLEHNAKTEILERHSVSRAQLGKLIAEARRLGLGPGVGSARASRQALEQMTRAFLKAHPEAAPRPRLNDEARERMSVDASWIEQPEYLRPVDGMVVEQHGEEDIGDPSFFNVLDEALG